MKEKGNSTQDFFSQEENNLGHDFWWFEMFLVSCYSESKLWWGQAKRKMTRKNSVFKAKTWDVTSSSQWYLF